MESIISQDNKNRSIFITGASSGIGYQAALRMLTEGDHLILPCRNAETSKAMLQELSNDLDGDNHLFENIYTPILDLADLNSIENCINMLLSENVDIDTLILNAGIQYTGDKEPRWSSQDYELTFAVNHLGHHFLTEGILPILQKSSRSRIVITASEVHNPEAPGGQFGKPAGLGSLDGIITGNGQPMIDGVSDFNADKAYKDSKLCNILFAKELSSRLCSEGFNIPIIAWAPGLVIPRKDGGFFRYSRKYNEFGQRLFALIVRDILGITETPEKAGELLFRVATEAEFLKDDFSYYSNKVAGLGRRIFEKSDISKEASDVNLSRLLWEKTVNIIDDFKDKSETF